MTNKSFPYVDLATKDKARERSARVNAAGRSLVYFTGGGHITATNLAEQLGVGSDTVMLRYRRLRDKGAPVTIESLKVTVSK